MKNVKRTGNSSNLRCLTGRGRESHIPQPLYFPFFCPMQFEGSRLNFGNICVLPRRKHQLVHCNSSVCASGLTHNYSPQLDFKNQFQFLFQPQGADLFLDSLQTRRPCGVADFVFPSLPLPGRSQFFKPLCVATLIPWGPSAGSQQWTQCVQHNSFEGYGHILCNCQK